MATPKAPKTGVHPSEAPFTIGEYYKYAETGKTEDWGVGLSGTANKRWTRLGTTVITEAGFNSALVTNATITLTKITDADEIAAIKTKWNIS
tara:strand:+ start:3770 stop:4045 length:276 start_codon:yes stop_codon:yes gene_type:complete